MSTDRETIETLDTLKVKLLAFSESPLYQYRISQRNMPVFGVGNPHARIMFIGEAPGKNEAKSGAPFCGAAGKLLDMLLDSIALNRSDIYITNIVKDRPPENRDPTVEEISLYLPFLLSEIAIVQPTILVTLGRYSMRYILELYQVDKLGSISELHGKVFNAIAPHGPVQILVLYHPAAALYNRALTDTIYTDIAQLKHL